MSTGKTASGPVDNSGEGSQHAGPMVVRMLLGGRLRRLREARGITGKDAGAAIRGSHSKISRLELGRTGFKRRDVADLLNFYGVSDEIERADLLTLVDRANALGWLHEYGDLLLSWAETRLELEQAARVIRCYEAQFVPGLLQTTGYARAGTRLHHPDAPAREVERRVSLLMRRQQVLHRPEPCRLWVVVDEAAVRRRIGTAATMRRQLEHLIEAGELPHVTIQVMPFTTGVAADGTITLLRFAERELGDVVYLDQFAGALYLDKPADVLHYCQVMDRLSTCAEPPAETSTIFRQILEET